MWQNLNHESLRQHLELRHTELVREAEQQRLAKQAIEANRLIKAETRGSARISPVAWLGVQLHKVTGRYRPEPAVPHLGMDWTPQS